MSDAGGFSPRRWWAMIFKELVQLLRDRLTFGMIVGMPVVQLILFGFAINTDPKRLPTAVITPDHSEFTRSIVEALRHSDYFAIVDGIDSEGEAQAALACGKVQFILSIPADFTSKLLRCDQPAILLEADATDPTATGTALAAVTTLPALVAAKDMNGPLADLYQNRLPFEVRVHRKYNPEGLTQYNIIPGLMGVILSLTMVMMTALAITRERERGTMENLLAMPLLPLEVMSGKIVPYIAIGLVQSTIILAGARFVFHVPVMGSVLALYLSALLFIAVNLAIGITFSSIAANQLQAMQLAVFYFLPNMLLSGFMFPFRGMPSWAQTVGECLPLTHFNRLVRGILLKGNGWQELWPDIWPLMVFGLAVMVIAVVFYRRTLD